MSREKLRQHGIDYAARDDPINPSSTTITSGNGTGILRSENAFRKIIGTYAPKLNLLFSSEFLTGEIDGLPDIQFLSRETQRVGFKRVCILLFVRDPLEHASSGYQQSIKREGSVETIEARFARFNAPEEAARVIEKIAAVGNVELTVRNYSRCRDQLLPVVAHWLGIPESALSTPPHKRVNRSLTMGELALQRTLNNRIGYSFWLADGFCEQLPDIEPDEIRPSVEVQTATWERLLPAIEKINTFLPQQEHYRCDLKPPVNLSSAYVFSDAQLQVIVDGFLKRSEQHPPSLAKSIARRTVRLLKATGRLITSRIRSP